MPAPIAGMVALPSGPYDPLSSQQKFDLMAHTAIAPSTAFGAVTNATWMQITGEMYEYGGGFSGWGKRLGASLANSETRNFFGNFLYPSLLKQDPRYFRKSSGGIVSRGIYALSRVFFIRSDDDGLRFNASELLSVASSTALQNAYYPDVYRGFGDTISRIFGAYSSDASGYVITEFTPDVLNAWRHHAPGKLKRLAGRIESKIPPSVINGPADTPPQKPQDPHSQ